MAHITHLQKWDDDFAVLIPDEIANDLGLAEGTHVSLSLDRRGLNIRKLTPSRDLTDPNCPDDLP